jgi:DNA polymerase I-like protein with 3'-5' exonuclease and polymerase domains
MPDFFYYGPETDCDKNDRYKTLILDARPKLVAIDTETISLVDKSPIGLGISVDEDHSFYFPLVDGPNGYVPWFLIQDPEVCKIFHNATFDLDVLDMAAYSAGAGDIDSTNLVDTSVIARTMLEPDVSLPWICWKVGKETTGMADILKRFHVSTADKLPLLEVALHCMQDTQVTFALYNKFKDDYDKGYCEIEWQIIDMLFKISKRGIKIDQVRRVQLEAIYAKEVEYLEGICKGYGFSPGSPQQVGYILAKRGTMLPFNRRKFGGKLSYNTSEEVLEFCPDPLAQVILKYRHSSKALNTYLIPLSRNPRAYTMFHLDAATGRVSSKDTNLQNIPTPDKERDINIRHIFLPDSGVFTDFDYVQVEMVTLGNIANDREMLKVFDSLYDYLDREREHKLIIGEEKPDLHQRTADFMGIERKIAKNVGFGMVYGATAQTLSETAKIPDLDRCQRLIDTWFRRYTGVRDWIYEQQRYGLYKGYITTLFGRKIRMPVEEGNEESIKRKAVNYAIQGCIPGASRILVHGKGYIPIKSVAGEHVNLWDGESYVGADVVFSGKKQSVIVTMSNNQHFICSPDHKILTMNTRQNKVWKTPKSLKIQDNICITGEVANPCGLIQLPNVMVLSHPKAPYGAANTNLISLSDIRDKFDLGLVLGRLASDGSVSSRSLVWIVAEHELPVLDRLKSILSVFPVKQHITPKGLHYLAVFSVLLARQVNSMDIKIKVPDIIWSDKELLRGFLSGWFDGDGGISGGAICLRMGEPTLSTGYPEDIQQALLLFGIRSIVYRWNGSITIRIRTRDNIIFKNSIGFINEKKQNSIPTNTSIRNRWQSERIQDVDFTSEYSDMYDIVNSDSEKFMVDGIITHNSAAEIMKRAMIKCKHLPIVLQVHDELLFDGKVDLQLGLENIASFRTPISIKELDKWE